MHLGVGVSSSTDGRATPAINLGLPFGKQYLLSATSAGVQTKAYYHSTYNMSFLKWMKGSKTLFGETFIGLGAGVHYGVKGIALDPDDEDSEVEKDTDFDIGPAFRMAVHPFDSFFVGFDFVMGLGAGALGLGFADSGAFAVGVNL